MDAAANTINIGLLSINVNNFMLTSDKSIIDTLNEDNLKIEFYSKTTVSLSKEEVAVSVGGHYLKELDEILKLEVLCVFSIEKMSKIIFINENNDKINFPKDLIATFLNVSIGTLRGILYEKTKNSVFAKFPFPLIGLDELIKNNIFVVE